PQPLPSLSLPRRRGSQPRAPPDRMPRIRQELLPELAHEKVALEPSGFEALENAGHDDVAICPDGRAQDHDRDARYRLASGRRRPNPPDLHQLARNVTASPRKPSLYSPFSRASDTERGRARSPALARRSATCFTSVLTSAAANVFSGRNEGTTVRIFRKDQCGERRRVCRRREPIGRGWCFGTP